MKRRQIARVDLSNPEKPKLVYDVKAFRSDIKDFKHDARVWIQIESYSPKRSLEQNSLLHIWLTILAEEIGIEIEDIKHLLKEKFLREHLKDKHGNEVADEQGELQFKIRDTSSLSKAEMSSFMDKVFMWSQSFLGCNLPQPLEQVPLNFDNLNK
jgi:hypothetical protein